MGFVTSIEKAGKWAIGVDTYSTSASLAARCSADTCSPIPVLAPDSPGGEDFLPGA